MAPIKRALSSYMIFCNDRRKQITDENPVEGAERAGERGMALQELLDDVGMYDASIELGANVWVDEWMDCVTQHYVQLAAKDKERYEKEKLENPVVVEEVDPDAQAEAANAAPNACVYQLGRVKKIIQSDPDTGKVSREALIAIAKASELFVQFLGTKGYENALFQNRRQIKASDITRTIQSTGSLDWLREDFPDVKPPSQAQKSGTARAKSAAAAKERAATLPSGSDFFKPQQASANKKASADGDDDGEQEE